MLATLLQIPARAIGFPKFSTVPGVSVELSSHNGLEKRKIAGTCEAEKGSRTQNLKFRAQNGGRNAPRSHLEH